MSEQNSNSRKSVLMVAGTASMIDQFNMDNISLLLSMGYKVSVACNFYTVVDVGCEQECLETLFSECDLDGHARLLGFRSDVSRLCLETILV